MRFTIFGALSFLANPTHGMRHGDVVSVAGKGRYPVASSRQRMGRMVVATLARPERSRDQIYVTRGPGPLTCGQAAKRFVAAQAKERVKLQKAPLAC